MGLGSGKQNKVRTAADLAPTTMPTSARKRRSGTRPGRRCRPSSSSPTSTGAWAKGSARAGSALGWLERRGPHD